ncbi:gluconate 2-dehydrogenase subunit 3 family protein [Mucilaginibacter sp. UR6-1]|uniref:gluconate 2-dehydrogenase subunit 3 family protein n=1 Tax=Mucilaginibacter sp. UR6-1 TaxID=1435643 RepID=UPI001E4387AC|nr:gluconate 2-dehydrogenase subunit 3 family protein [Mucilaginibacter sp. UR6-1]MCC8411046.1 gluconate 2-dehydrogenase subunit 3 family protein [Mucilaginibacter sp. UR6-1]
MNRRDSLKALGLGTLSTTLLLDACKPKPEKKVVETPAAAQEQAQPQATDTNPGRQAWEIERDKLLQSQRYFTAQEMAAITILADIIIPKDDVSGSASDAKVPDFIEFIAKDQPEHQVPLRGGLRWLDVQCLNRFNAIFAECKPEQRIELIDQIAYPKKAKPAMQQGVAFFNRMRDLVATGFFTSQMGMKDIGYAGNAPNPQWAGVPADVLKQYGFSNST